MSQAKFDKETQTLKSWTKPEVNVISIPENTLGGGAGVDDGAAGLS